MVAAENITTLGLAYRYTYIGIMIFMCFLLFLCLVRAIKGPRVADRIVAVNMMGTMVIVIIAIMAQLLNEGYLVDICLIYSMISFLAVIVLTKVYTGVHVENQKKKQKEEETDGNI